jgi:hypothetical protein
MKFFKKSVNKTLLECLILQMMIKIDKGEFLFVEKSVITMINTKR